MVGSDHYFGQKSQSDELDADDDKQDGQQEKWPSADALFEDQLLVRENEADDSSRQAAERTDEAKNLKGPGGIAQQKFDRHQVEDHPRETEDGVLGFSKPPRAVIDFHFGDGYAQLAGDSRDEAVQLSIEFDVLDDFFAEGLQSAAVVVKLNPRDEGDKPIGNDGRQTAVEESVFPLSPPTADDIVPLFDFLDEKRKVVRIILQIGIQSDDNFPSSIVEAGRKRRGLAEIFSEFDDYDSGILLLKRFERSIGGIETSVVHEDDFVRCVKPLQGSGDLLIEKRQILFLVVDGDDQREVRGIMSFHPR